MVNLTGTGRFSVKLVCDMYEVGDIPNDYKVNKTVRQTNARTTVLLP